MSESGQILLFVIVGVVLVVNIESARILMWIPMPSISHQLPFRPLSQELARRGHEVIVITANPAFSKGKTPPNLTEIDVHEASYNMIKKSRVNFRNGNKDDWIDNFDQMYDILTEFVFAEMDTPQLQDIIKGKEHFDLLILESCARSTLALSHIYKVPVILVSSLGAVFDNADVMGIPSHPFLYPSVISQRLYNLTFTEKLKEFYNHLRIMKVIRDHENIENIKLKKHFGDDLPPLSDLKNNVDMLFINVHPIFEGNYPVPPNVIYIWGIHTKPEEPLPKDLQTYLDSSENGVIYMSFGSNTDPTKLPQEMIQKFIHVFCKLPFNILWKWNGDHLPGKCDNIRIDKWFPQPDLLRNPKIKAFVTQGGLQSTDEAITAGVPLVGMPMMSDQWYNVEKYVHLRIGVHVDTGNFTEQEFKEAILKVINDKSYSSNVRRLRELMRDEPASGLQRAIWWTEYVLRHGGARHLRSPAANISWSDYLQLDLVLTILGGLLVSLTVLLVALYSTFCYVCRYFTRKLKDD